MPVRSAVTTGVLALLLTVSAEPVSATPVVAGAAS